MRAELGELVESADLNALLRAVDGLCAGRAWDELLELADACEDALERGKQLWPIASHIDYRVALEAPGAVAAQVLHPDVGRFAHGPLTEVAASGHSWEELAPHIEIPQVAAYVAQERVLRGEDLRGEDRAHPEVLELPSVVLPWEPAYRLARFHTDHVEVPEPWDPRVPLRSFRGRPAAEIDEPDLTTALLDLVTPWTAESNGAARAVVVEGDAVAAASAVTVDTLRLGPLDLDEALQLMAWAAASGGAHGRRRGGALGRFMALYVGAALTGLRWPAAASELGAALRDLRFYRWDEGEPEKGWVLRIAVEDPVDGWAAAIGATDLLEEESASSSF